MKLIPIVLVGLMAMAAPMVQAETAPAAVQEQVIAPKKGLAALFQVDPAKKAARIAARETRRAERLAAREARIAARAAKGQGGLMLSTRGEVKAAVQQAIENKPKGRWWCVPFARMVSGLDIRGNAKTWWASAEGRYPRGKEPKVGAVMSFAASRAMPLGHVAVVSKVVSDREILIDQANWVRWRVTQDDRVIDVSEKGDWSKVRVENSAGSPGRVNPVNGFIYKG